MTCEHKYVYLRKDLERQDRVETHWDVFYCEKCLQYQRIMTMQRYENGDGRWHDHPVIRFAPLT